MPKTLQEWLSWQETLHPSEIDLGLERVAQVVEKLLPDCFESSPAQFPFTVITIAGTNGKGSTVAMLEAILSEAGYRTGSYTSPHLLHYNERIKINQTAVSDQLICDSFERIDKARIDSDEVEISLTYFEFATLAAIDIFHQQLCEIVILEVGLGGRLDAVNVIDPDIALITTIDIDHQDWLGNDRNTIGLEKAGIYRKDKPALFGDSDLPDSIKKRVAEQDLAFYQYSVDYKYSLREKDNTTSVSTYSGDMTQWDWLVSAGILQTDARQTDNRYNLPPPNLTGVVQYKNASNVLMILELLKNTFPVSPAAIKLGLQKSQLAGRFQLVSNEPVVILDVAHNVQAARVLRQSCEQLYPTRKLNVIVGMLKDKDVTEVLTILEPVVNSWRIIELDSPRAMPAVEIEAILRNIVTSKVDQELFDDSVDIQTYGNFEQAFFDMTNNELFITADEIILVFGSFFTVTDAMQTFKKLNTYE